MTTDEFAQAIVKENVNPHFVAMAKFWLLKDDIYGYLWASHDLEPSATISELLAKIDEVNNESTRPTKTNNRSRGCGCFVAGGEGGTNTRSIAALRYDHFARRHQQIPRNAARVYGSPSNSLC